MQCDRGEEIIPVNAYLTYWSILVTAITFVNAAMATTDHEQRLPNDLRSVVIQHIISGQDDENNFKGLLSCRLISKRFKQACDNPCLWLRFLPMLRLNTNLDSGVIKISEPSEKTLESSAETALYNLTPLVKKAIKRKGYTAISLWTLYRMAELSIDPNHRTSVQKNNNHLLSRLASFSEVHLLTGGPSLNDLLLARACFLSASYKKRIAECKEHAKNLVRLAKEEEEKKGSDVLLSDIDAWDNMQTDELNRNDQSLIVVAGLKPDTFKGWEEYFEIFASVKKSIERLESNCRDLMSPNANETELEWPN